MQILSSECQISFLWKIYERLSEKATAYSRGCALSMLRDDDIEQIFLADTSGISILIKRQRKIEKRTKTSSSHEKKIRCAEVVVEKSSAAYFGLAFFVKIAETAQRPGCRARSGVGRTT